MLVACCDHGLGISTWRCSKTTWPFSPPITASRSSHSTWSKGSVPAVEKNRGNSSPIADARRAFGAASTGSVWLV